MSDTFESSLSGNNDTLYSSKRHYDEFEPFAQPLPPPAEPLFPSIAPAGDQATVRATESVTASVTENATGYGSVYASDHVSSYASDSINDPINEPMRDGAQTYSSEQESADATTQENLYWTGQVSSHPSEHASLYASDSAAHFTNEPDWDEAMPESIVYNHNHTPNYQKYSNQSYEQLFSIIEPSLEQEPPTVTPATGLDEPVQALSQPEPPTAAPSMMQFQDLTPAPPQENQHDANEKPAGNDQDLLFTRHFAVLMDLMQHGAWPQAVAKLQAMRVEYPGVKALDGLLDEATLKAELMAQWTHKVKGRRLTVGQEFLIRRSLPFLLLLALFISGTVFYRIFLAPSRQVMAMERANQALVDEAGGLVQAGQIDEAIQLYTTVLMRDPNNDSAQQGLVTANRQTGLSVIYDLAIRVANSGNLERSLLMLQSIKDKSPTFRDIDQRLTRVNTLLTAEHSYKSAEKAFSERRWIDAITNYEQTQVASPDYQALHVASQMSAAYFYGAQKLMAEWPSEEFGPEQIRDFLRKAQTVNGQDQTLAISLADLEDVIRGERSLHNNDIDQAIKAWRPLYDQKPAILGGYLAEELYRAYLTLASGMSSSDAAQAQELYTLAAALPVRDSGEARAQLQGLGAPLPPVQPMVTPQPTVSLDPSVTLSSAPRPTVAAVETPTPAAQSAVAAPASAQQPAPAPSAYAGWIAYRSTRDGTVQVYIMRGDGSEQQPAPDDIRVRLDSFYQDEQRNADGRMLTVQSASGRSDSNIFITSSDGSQMSTIADSTGDETDPVWSRIGDRIAFVSNHTGNDEVWIMRGDGSEQRQLTSNTWEWDKHPTWSPDSSQIAFFSNRSGQRQIWVMKSDGSGQSNLSNNAFEDWDPVWLK
jgi:TolB protein